VRDDPDARFLNRHGCGNIARHAAKASESRADSQPDPVRDGQTRTGWQSRELAQCRAALFRTRPAARHKRVYRERVGGGVLPRVVKKLVAARVLLNKADSSF